MNTALSLSFYTLPDPLLDESAYIFSLMGWSGLPEDLKRAIAVDLIGYRDELLGLYSTLDPAVQARRRSVYWWVEQYRDGTCSLDTAIASLRIDPSQSACA